MIQTNEEYKP